MMRVVIAAVLLALPLAVPAQWLEGVHYQRIDEPAEREPGAGIEVIEVFWYGCPSCNALEPHLTRWLEDKPDDVEFKRIAASLNPSWRTHARAYYTAEALDVVDEIHQQMFRAIHRQRRHMNDTGQLAELFQEHAGVDEETFLSTFNSFSVDTRARRGDHLVRQYRVTGTPTLIVNGKYRTGPSSAQGYAELIELLDHLVALERRGGG